MRSGECGPGVAESARANVETIDLSTSTDRNVRSDVPNDSVCNRRNSISRWVASAKPSESAKVSP